MNLHLQTSKQLGICGIEYILLMVIFIAVIITEFDDVQNLFNTIAGLVKTDILKIALAIINPAASIE